MHCRGVAKLAEHDVQGVGHPCMCWCLSWRGQVAEESSPWRFGPGHDLGRAAPSLVCSLFAFVALSYLCPSWLLPARRPDSGQLPVLTGTNLVGARTLKSGHWDGLQTSSPVRHKARPLATGDLVVHTVSGKDRGHAQALPARSPGGLRDARGA